MELPSRLPLSPTKSLLVCFNCVSFFAFQTRQKKGCAQCQMSVCALKKSGYFLGFFFLSPSCLFWSAQASFRSCSLVWTDQEFAFSPLSCSWEFNLSFSPCAAAIASRLKSSPPTLILCNHPRLDLNGATEDILGVREDQWLQQQQQQPLR